MQTLQERSGSITAHLASGELMGIKIGMNHVTHMARVRTEAERSAMLWLTNYAHLRDLTADALSVEVGLTKAEIREALTKPDARLESFTRQVNKLRDKFEREQIPALLRVPSIPLANTKINR